jgi:osmoprotectant transport system ATP-binding protein
MIDLRCVSKVYANGHIGLQDVTLHVDTGMTIALLGASGSGKTTVLKLINRLLTPTQGSVSVDGMDVAQRDPISLRRGIGYVVQDAALFPHWTAAANVEAVPRLLGWPAERRRARARELFDLMGLDWDQLSASYPAQLSGGQRQRVGLARALAADPPIVLMDEPFGALDPLIRRRLQDEFLDLKQRLRKTVVLVTHDVDEAFRLADRVAVIADGRLVQEGPPDVVQAAPASDFVSRFLGASRAH